LQNLLGGGIFVLIYKIMIIMKKFLLLILTVFAAMTVSAQGSRAFEKGYRGNVSLGGNISVTRGWINNSVELTTSHGYGFGDGMYVGGGVGLNVSFNDYAGIPVFFDVKYNILDWKLSPYVDYRMGMEVMIVDDLGYAFIASPGIGFDYRKMSFRVGYKCEAGRVNDWNEGPVVTLFKLHTISLSAAINF